MKKIFFLLIGISLFCFPGKAQIFTPTRKIICYFTNPVNNAVSTGQNAVPLIRSAGDTIIDYINRAKYTIDIALFDYVEDSTWYEGGYVPAIHTAINNAYNRGVKIRWIHNTIDSSSGPCCALTPNYGLAHINKAIPTLGSPSGGSYSIMHNKFMVIDGRSSNPDDPILWTGSMNWEPGQIDKDENNIIIIQDSGVAHAYLTEFNQMWGDTVEGGMYNLSKSKFGPFKKDITLHHFLVGANNTPVEVYFSPSDSTNNHIISTMETAKSEIDVSMFTFTYNINAVQMVAEQNKGIYVTCLMDQSSTGYSPYSTLTAGNGLDTLMQLYLEGVQTPIGCGSSNCNTAPKSIDHNKYMIVDPCNTQSDPKVLTGSHNWSESANTTNDENTVIVHDPTITNLYYQSYLQTFMKAENPAYSFYLKQQCVADLGINSVKQSSGDMTIYPDPVTSRLSVIMDLPGNDFQYKIYNAIGQLVSVGKFQQTNINKIDVSALPPGLFMLVVQNGNSVYTRKFCKN